MKKNYPFALALTLVLVFPLVLAGCNNTIELDDPEALHVLAGRWYNNHYDFAFEITQTGEGSIAGSKTQYVVSASKSIVHFRNSHGTLMGSFHYSIKNSELTMTVGTGDFKDAPSASPFIKSGTIPSGGKVPVELIGKWYAKSSPSSSPNFEITKSGLMTIQGSTTPYTIKIQGSTISLLEGSFLRGDFQYLFMDEQIIVTKGTDICAGLAVLSPFAKQP